MLLTFNGLRAPRYNTTTESYRGLVSLASVLLWIPLSTIPGRGTDDARSQPRGAN